MNNPYVGELTCFGFSAADSSIKGSGPLSSPPDFLFERDPAIS